MPRGDLARSAAGGAGDLLVDRSGVRLTLRGGCVAGAGRPAPNTAGGDWETGGSDGSWASGGGDWMRPMAAAGSVTGVPAGGWAMAELCGSS